MNTGRTHFKKGMTPWNKGLHIYLGGGAKKGSTGYWLGKKRTQGLKDKVSEKVKQLWQNPEYREKMVQSRMGYKETEEHKNKIGKRIRELGIKPPVTKGAANHLWRGGITPINHQIRSCLKYKLWVKTCMKRDNYTCQDCGIRGCYLEVDHKISFSSIMKRDKIKSLEEAIICEKLWDLSNGKTLCKPCHSKTPTYMGRGRWNQSFNTL